MEKKSYELSFSFFIGNNIPDAIERKDMLLDALDNIPEIGQPDVYDDGEDWCIDCIAEIKSGAWRNIHKALDHKLMTLIKNVPYATWDYHYMKGLDNDFYWCP